MHYFVVGSETRIFSAIECLSAVQGHQCRWFWYWKHICD